MTLTLSNLDHDLDPLKQLSQKKNGIFCLFEFDSMTLVLRFGLAIVKIYVPVHKITFITHTRTDRREWKYNLSACVVKTILWRLHFASAG